ncbi:MAG: nuclear transport factor 2 family protein [Firmicutes bacterium]|nr:nuclear transport factor 2 family protein [Bacillota bacterium]
MKKITVTVLVLLFVVCFTAGAYCNEGAEQQVKTFYSYMQKGDVENMLSILSDDILKQISESKEPKGIGHDLGLAVAVTGAIKEKVLSVKINELKMTSEDRDNGVVAVTTTYKVVITRDGKVETEESKDTFLLKEENDKWVIFDLKQ